MRHGKKFNHLSRTTSHRRAMLANMASSLIKYKRVSTTVAKAKALRTYVEPIITKSKEDTTHSRRVVFSYLQDKDTVKELFSVVAGKVAARPGGYTRIIKVGNRAGDNADMCVIELVDFNENLLTDTTSKTKSRRSRRGGKKKSEGSEQQAQEKEVKEEVKAEKKEPKAEAKTTEAKAETKEAPELEAKAAEAEEAEVKEEAAPSEKAEAKADQDEKKSDENSDESGDKKDKE